MSVVPGTIVPAVAANVYVALQPGDGVGNGVGVTVGVGVGCTLGVGVGVGVGNGVGVAQPVIPKVICWPVAPPVLHEYCVNAPLFFSTPTAPTVVVAGPIVPKTTLNVDEPSNSCTS